MAIITASYIDGVHTRTVDPDASLTQQAVEDFMVEFSAVAGVCIAEQFTIETYDPHGAFHSYTPGISLSGEVK